MNPIFFPYTYVSRHIAEAIYACLGRFTVYQPLTDQLPPSMQTLVDDGIVDIRTPMEGGNRELAAAAENYMEWASTHADNSGRHLASLKAIQASAPVSDDTLSSKIVAEVRKQMSGHSDSLSSNPILAARIFLYFAQRFDQQSLELNHDLIEFSHKEQALVRELKMEDDALAAEFNQRPAPGSDENTDYLVSARLEAWTRVLLEDTEPADLFVTHRPAVMEQVLDNVPAAQKVLDFPAVPRLSPATAALASWREQLFSYLFDMAHNNKDIDSDKKILDIKFPAAENTVSLKSYLVPNQDAKDVLCQATGINIAVADQSASIASERNTLLALVGL